MSRASVGQKLAQRVLSRGKSLSSSYFRALFMVIPGEPTRSSFVVSKKVSPKAAGRNKIKRRGRAIFNKDLRSQLVPGTAVLFFAKNAAKDASFDTIAKDITTLSTSIKKITTH